MGKEYFDFSTIMHFMFGFLSTSTLLPSKPIISAFIANIFHLISELNEHNNSPNGEILETEVNHLGDLLFFFAGSILGVIYGTNIFIQKKYSGYRQTILIIVILAFINEIGREVFPYDWPFNPAFKPFKW
jgi:hypothetical protein